MCQQQISFHVKRSDQQRTREKSAIAKVSRRACQKHLLQLRFDVISVNECKASLCKYDLCTFLYTYIHIVHRLLHNVGGSFEFQTVKRFVPYVHQPTPLKARCFPEKCSYLGNYTTWRHLIKLQKVSSTFSMQRSKVSGCFFISHISYFYRR